MAITLDTISKDFHSIVVEATDLDIRDLNSATDSVSAVQSGTWNVGITGNVTVDQGTSPWVIGDGGGSITVDGTVAATQSGAWTVELGSTTLAALETITVDQGTSPWVISATDLDIRNLDYTQDNVAIKGATGNQLAINADGSLNASFTESGYSTWKTSKVSVSTTAASLVTALTNRLRIEIQNLGSNDIYIKENNTNVLDGIKVPKGSSYEQSLDVGAAIFAISAAGSADVRVAEYAA